VTQEQKPLSRSEREARIKDKAGWVITVLGAFVGWNFPQPEFAKRIQVRVMAVFRKD
jgi:hypothetical protein